MSGHESLRTANPADESTELAELREKIKLLQEILELKKQIAVLEDRPTPYNPVYPYNPYPYYPTVTWDGTQTYAAPMVENT